MQLDEVCSHNNHKRKFIWEHVRCECVKMGGKKSGNEDCRWSSYRMRKSEWANERKEKCGTNELESEPEPV